jgi:hypothetical protein
MTWSRVACAAALVAAVAACSKAGDESKSKTPPAEAGQAGAATVDGAKKAWEAAGLRLADFHPIEDSRKLGGDCQAGNVAEVAVVLCRYDQPQAASDAEENGLAMIGDATGASLANGPLLLVVADRHQADPNGRRINEITKTFRLLE